MSDLKRRAIIVATCLALATTFIAGIELRSCKPKRFAQTLASIDSDTAILKPEQGQRLSAPIATAKEKRLQKRLDAAVTDIARLRKENLVLIERLDAYTSKDNDIEINSFDAWKMPLSDYIEPNQVIEQLEARFSYENHALEWANTVEASVTNKDYNSLSESNELVDARCQSTLCRIELIHLSQEGEALFWTNALGIEGLSTEQVHFQRIDNAEEGLKTIIFVARQGHKINRANLFCEPGTDWFYWSVPKPENIKHS